MKMKKCRLCGRERMEGEPYCGRCEKIVSDVQADLRAEMGV